MMRIFLSIIFLLLGLIMPSQAQAKRLLPRAAPAKTGGTQRAVTTSRGVTAKVSFRGDRLALLVDFSNLSIAKSVNYSLSYQTRGTTQGASGTISPTEDATSRELLFGTCSHGVCRYDSGISNAKFVVTTTLKNGLKVVKSYKLIVNR